MNKLGAGLGIAKCFQQLGGVAIEEQDAVLDIPTNVKFSIRVQKDADTRYARRLKFIKKARKHPKLIKVMETLGNTELYNKEVQGIYDLNDK